MKKKQKRYLSEQEILKDYYASEEKAAQFLKAAEAHDLAATELIITSICRELSKNEVEQLGWLRKCAAVARRKAERQAGIMAKLRRAQDAINTSTLAGVVPDTSVVLT